MEEIIPLAIFALQEALKHAPGLATELTAIFNKPDGPTEDDWKALHAKYPRQSYESIVTETGLGKAS